MNAVHVAILRRLHELAHEEQAEAGEPWSRGEQLPRRARMEELTFVASLFEWLEWRPGGASDPGAAKPAAWCRCRLRLVVDRGSSEQWHVVATHRVLAAPRSDVSRFDASHCDASYVWSQVVCWRYDDGPCYCRDSEEVARLKAAMRAGPPVDVAAIEDPHGTLQVPKLDGV